MYRCQWHPVQTIREWVFRAAGKRHADLFSQTGFANPTWTRKCQQPAGRIQDQAHDFPALRLSSNQLIARHRYAGWRPAGSQGKRALGIRQQRHAFQPSLSARHFDECCLLV